MRPVSGLVLGVAVTAVLAGCSLLVSFDDPSPAAPIASDDDDDTPPRGTSSSSSSSGDTSTSSSSSSGSSSSSSSSSGGATKFPPDPDPTFDLTGINCGDLTLPNCAGNFDRNGRTVNANVTLNDLIDCTGGTPKSIKHCPNGCAVMPNGFPDECDDCQGRATGTYCGRDMRNFPANLADIAIHCENNRRRPTVGTDLGVHVCGANACATVCPRAPAVEPHQPACCK